MSKHYSSLIIGHITMDTNTDHLGSTVHQAGGAVLYSSACAFALGHNAAVLTKLNKNDRDRLSAFTLPPENIYCLDAEKSCNMVNKYFTADKERRNSVCESSGDMISASEIPEGLTANIYHLAGLIYGDYDENIIKDLSLRGAVAVDVQAYLRHADKNTGGRMYFEDWKEKKELLPYVTYLKTDAAEAEILTGLSQRAKAAELLYSWGAKEVLITHNTEILVYDGKKIYTCPIRAGNLSGRTGRGDTSFAAYINERLSASPEEALLTSAAAVSLKMETPGPLKASKEEIESYKNKFFNDIAK